MERHLCSQLNVAEFSHLVVGVIEKQPQVVRFFQLPPSMSNVVEITDVDVMEFIRTMRMRSRGVSKASGSPTLPRNQPLKESETLVGTTLRTGLWTGARDSYPVLNKPPCGSSLCSYNCRRGT